MSVGWEWSPPVATIYRPGWRRASVWVAVSASARVRTVGRDPVDSGKELLVKRLDGVGRKKAGAGAGAEDGVEHDRDVQRLDGGEKGGDGGGDLRRAQHADLDSGGREVGGEGLKGAMEKVWSDGLALGDTEGGLHGERGERGGAEEAMGGKGLEIGGDACAAGWIMPGDGEKRSAPGSGTRRKGSQSRQPHAARTLSYKAANCKAI